MARPKLTPETQARICEALQAGNTRQDAAYHGGVNPGTLRRWVTRPEPEYRALRAAIKKAESQAAVHNVAVIKRATIGGAVIERRTVTRKDGTVEVVEKFASPVWQAAAWWLERMRPEFRLDGGAEFKRLMDRLGEVERRVAGSVPSPPPNPGPGETVPPRETDPPGGLPDPPPGLLP